MFNPESRNKFISVALALSLSLTACFEGKTNVSPKRGEKVPVSVPTSETSQPPIPIGVPTSEQSTTSLANEIITEPLVSSIYSKEFLELTIAEKTLLDTTISQLLQQMGENPENIKLLLAESKKHLEASGLQNYLEKIAQKRGFSLDDLFILVSWRPVDRFLYNDGKTWTGQDVNKGVPTVGIYEIKDGLTAYAIPVLTTSQKLVEYSSDIPDVSVVTENNNKNPFNLNYVRNNIKEIDYAELIKYLESITKIQSLQFVNYKFELQTAVPNSFLLINPFNDKLLLVRTE